MNQWTIGRTFAAIIVMAFVAALAVGGMSAYALQQVVEAKDDVSEVHGANAILALSILERVESERAEFHLTLLGDASADAKRLQERADLHQLADDLERRLDQEAEKHSGDQASLTAEAGSLQAFREALGAIDAWEKSTDAVLAQVASGVLVDPRGAMRDLRVDTTYDQAHHALEALEEDQMRALDRQSAEASGLATRATWYLLLGCGAAAGLLGFSALSLSSTLTRRVTEAIQHVQSASAELQASATQQAAATKEQISTVTEVSNTFNELHSTTRQIAESAQRVAGIAHDTAIAAEDGNSTVGRGREAVGNIKNEVEVVVHYMLDLGRKSQQIGGILEMINELSEQTNILAINASIEAAGAGEAGARFGVVADEIRKLADRVSGSTKEIRSLIDEIRASVNTTVMATESGSKAVDTGVAKFGEVTVVFESIGKGIVVVSEAAREIELGTRQQATAVDQVGMALGGLQQVARETEAATTQTAQTAQQLVNLARDLGHLVHHRAG